MTATLIIEGFEPLRLALPTEVDLVGEVWVQLPPVHVNLIDLSLGGLIPDQPHVGADLPLTRIAITLSEPTTVGHIVDAIIESASSWWAIWQASQKALDQCGPILG